MINKYFFELPIYRISEKTYYEQRENFVDKYLRKFMLKRSDYEAVDRLQMRYGGCWDFNEIIGFLRLYFLGSQIRGEYFGVNKKRLMRTRTKLFVYQTWKLAPEIEIPPKSDNNDIYLTILEYIKNCNKELKKGYFDTRLFEKIGPYMNWLDFLEIKECERG